MAYLPTSPSLQAGGNKNHNKNKKSRITFKGFVSAFSKPLQGPCSTPASPYKYISSRTRVEAPFGDIWSTELCRLSDKSWIMLFLISMALVTFIDSKEEQESKVDRMGTKSCRPVVEPANCCRVAGSTELPPLSNLQTWAACLNHWAMQRLDCWIMFAHVHHLVGVQFVTDAKNVYIYVLKTINVSQNLETKWT